MKERPIGERFGHPWKGTLEVAASAMPNDCTGCVFMETMSPYCTNDPDRTHTGTCSFERRTDGKDVIFIKAGKGDTDA